jgi:CpeT protein
MLVFRHIVLPVFAMPGKFLFVTAICVGVVFGATAVFAQKSFQDKEIKTFAEWMTGSFDTFAQVDADEEANAAYRHIRALLHVQPVEIAGLNDALALYVENAAAETRSKPYRQRVYILKRGADGKIIVEIHRLKNQEQLVNAYKNPALLKNITLENLTREPGCDMTFERVNRQLFKGSAGTNKTCKSALRGATHTVSNTELTPTQLTNLDQGFDDAGNHKWGPPPGVIGHIFVRRKR